MQTVTSFVSSYKSVVYRLKPLVYMKIYFVQTFYGKFVGDRLEQKMAIEFFVHAYIAYVSVGDNLKSLLSYGLRMRKLLIVELRLKWRSRFSRTCLYSVCECGRQPKIASFVWTSYGEVVGSRVKAKMAVEFFPYMPIQRI